MARTKITSDQSTFNSANTGDHLLDTYLEDCEIGGVALPTILSNIVDASGAGLDPASFQFRVNPLVATEFQARTAPFGGPEDGWLVVGTLPPGAPGPGTGDMLASNNLSDVASASLSRSNLGLAALAILATVSTAVIDDDAVTTAKLASGTADTLLGHDAAGDPSEITAGAGVTISAGVISSSSSSTLTDQIYTNGIDYTAGAAGPLVLALPVDAVNEESCTVTFDGLVQHSGFVVASGPDTITFAAGVPALVSEVRVKIHA